MSQCSVFIATSLDGFISRADGSIDWLNDKRASIPEGEEGGFNPFMARIDALVMGRNTFEQVLGFDTWAYGETPIIVLSRQLTQLPEKSPATAMLSSAEPAQLVKQLAEKGLNRLYIDGGLTVQSFLAAGLIDEITITVIPVILGSGKPLFGSLPKEQWLELLESKTFSTGLVQHKYRVIREA